jgi:hypothetical protein
MGKNKNVYRGANIYKSSSSFIIANMSKKSEILKGFGLNEGAVTLYLKTYLSPIKFYLNRRRIW